MSSNDSLAKSEPCLSKLGVSFYMHITFEVYNQKGKRKEKKLSASKALITRTIGLIGEAFFNMIQIYRGAGCK